MDKKCPSEVAAIVNSPETKKFIATLGELIARGAERLFLDRLLYGTKQEGKAMCKKVGKKKR